MPLFVEKKALYLPAWIGSIVLLPVPVPMEIETEQMIIIWEKESIRR
jgi:hypothetical protein